MLGRPVVRRLVGEGFSVRALVRDLEKARRVLPGGCELVAGDVRDDPSLEAAMADIDAVYVNLAAPRSPRRPDVERDGVPRIVSAAGKTGVGRLLKISFLGVPHAEDAWWQIRHKTESERAVMHGGIGYTIFRPTWFMESIPLFCVGRRLLMPKTPPLPVYWVAGDDYARQVVAALRTSKALNRCYTIQGPEPVTFRAAAQRFARAGSSRPFKVAEIPRWVVRVLAVASADARYVRDLLEVTFQTNMRFNAQEAWDDLGEPTMRIEDYVAYMERTGDVPSK